MVAQTIVVGLNPNGKRPAALWAVNPGVGASDLSAIPRFLLLVGNKTSAGSAVADQDLNEIFPNTDINALYGARSELAWMIRMARKYPGVRIKAIACAEAGGATAATLTITVTGTAGSNGTLRFYLATKTINVTVPSGTTQNATAALIQAAFDADLEIPVTATVLNNVVTLTVANASVRGNDWSCYFDPAEKPTTTAIALAGSGATNPGANGVVGAKFGSGAGTDNLTNVLAILNGKAFFTAAFAQNDTSTNAALLKAYSDAKGAVGTQVYEHIVLGYTGSYANAVTLAKTTINRHRFQVGWQRGSEAHPAMVAASLAARRHQKEQLSANPNRRFNGDVLLGIPAARAVVDWPSGGETGEEDAALNNGVTPIRSDEQGDATIVRAITTLCVRNGVPFYGTIDCGQARTPDVTSDLASLLWDTEYSVANEHVDDDPEDGEEDRPPGTATPRGWSSYLQGVLEAKIPKHWFSSVSVSTEYDPDTKMLMCTINLEVAPLNHRIAGNINQS